MTEAEYTNLALTDVCEMLLDQYALSPDEIANLARSIEGECKAILEKRNEAAWMDRQQSLMESGGIDDSAYRRNMKLAGRGHLLGGRS